MDALEARQIVKVLQMAYPHYYKNKTKNELIEQIEFYGLMLSEYPLELVVKALTEYVKENTYPPTLAGIIKHIKKIMGNGKDTNSELWNEMKRLVGRASVVTKEEFSQIQSELKIWIGSLSNLRELGDMPIDTFNTVIRGQFMKEIETIKEQEIERLTLEAARNMKKLGGEK